MEARRENISSGAITIDSGGQHTAGQDRDITMVIQNNARSVYDGAAEMGIFVMVKRAPKAEALNHELRQRHGPALQRRRAAANSTGIGMLVE